jgi:Xaa-Pro aminopeptidase
VRVDKEIEGFRRCHRADGVAMAKFWAWRAKREEVDEYEAACYMDNLRHQQQDNRGTSFVTISSGGPNGAIIHYHPTEKATAVVKKDMIHLLDSGGQYLDGTTDVTRVFHFGTPTAS